MIHRFLVLNTCSVTVGVCVRLGGGGRVWEETSLSLSLPSKIYHNLTLTYRHSSDDFFTLNGANGVIKYLAVCSGPAGVVNKDDFTSWNLLCYRFY